MIDLTPQTAETWDTPEPHTPTPWSEFAESGEWWIQGCDDEGNPIGKPVADADNMSTADMFFILQACNNFDALLAACEGAYLALLQSLPATRIRIQSELSTLRNAIADAREQDREEIQHEFEAKAS